MDKNIRILIVDDFSTMRRIVKNLLNDLGFFNTTEADDGSTAHRRVALEDSADGVGDHLEAAADDGLVGPAEDPDEAVVVDAGEVGGADPALIGELSGLHLQDAVDDAQLAAGVGPADAARLVAQNCWWSRRFQPATPPPNSVAP